MKNEITPRRIWEAIYWIRTMKRTRNVAAARRWERHLLALISAVLVACSGDTFTILPLIIDSVEFRAPAARP